MTNLLQETIQELSDYGHTPEDVLWVGSRNGRYSMPWERFAEMADREYDDGYGWNQVAEALVVVGNGWWLERHEYDGSEWWEHKAQPVAGEAATEPPGIFVVNYAEPMGRR